MRSARSMRLFSQNQRPELLYSTCMQQKQAALTDRQWEVLRFINAHRRQEQRNPTCRDLNMHFGWSSPNAAYDHLKALIAKGVIVKRDQGNYLVLSPWKKQGNRNE